MTKAFWLRENELRYNHGVFELWIENKTPERGENFQRNNEVPRWPDVEYKNS